MGAYKEPPDPNRVRRHLATQLVAHRQIDRVGARVLSLLWPGRGKGPPTPFSKITNSNYVQVISKRQPSWVLGINHSSAVGKMVEMDGRQRELPFFRGIK